MSDSIPEQVRPLRKWCTVSEVENGWLVNTERPHCLGAYDETNLFVFTSLDGLSEWVKKHFAREEP